jgi:transcriptional antiterminator RfaH
VVEHRQLFPGYLFISFDLAAAPWRAVNSTYGVVRLVSFEARRPQIVPADLVEEIMARCGAEGRPIPHAVLECGDSVRFTIGPFADLVATVESVSPEKRIWVMLEALGRKTRVLAEQAAVKRVCPV